MAKKTREQLLKEAKARQAARERALKKTQKLQQRIPSKIPGVPVWATRAARSPTMAEISQLAFSNRLNEAVLIAALEQTQPTVGSVAGDVVRDESRIVNQDAVDLARDLVQIDWETGGARPKPKRKRSEKQLMNDSIQADALKSINKRARKKDGTFKKGWDQRRVMLLAQKECTKERERLGLCERKSTRKGQRRKTARRAYEK
jgi:hypothetical protein